MLFKGADQTARMRRLVCTFVVHILTEDRVSPSRLNFIRYPENLRNNTVVRLDSSRLGRISILCLQGGKGVEENLTISVDN